MFLDQIYFYFYRLKIFKRYSKFPISIFSAIKFVYNFFLKYLTLITFFTSNDSLFQFLIVRTLKVRPRSLFP